MFYLKFKKDSQTTHTMLGTNSTIGSIENLLLNMTRDSQVGDDANLNKTIKRFSYSPHLKKRNKLSQP